MTVAPNDAVAQALWGQQGAAINPQELNRYSYVNNNPIRNTDPTGHCPWCIGAVVGAAVGAGLAYGVQVAGNMNSGMDFQQALTTNINGASIVTGALAGAVVGGSLGMATGATVAGYTVGSALQLGAVGAATNMAGNVIGQAATSSDINLTDIAVAGVAGFTAGVAAPLVASSAIGGMAGGYIGSVGLGVAANTGQYSATQSIKSQPITTRGLTINALSGAAGGVFGGPTTKLGGLSFLKPSLRAKDLLLANVTRANLARGVFGGAASNWNYDQYLPGDQ